MGLHNHPRHIGRVLLAAGVTMIGLGMMGPVSANQPDNPGSNGNGPAGNNGNGPAGNNGNGPAGNNGTIKIDGLGLNDGPGHSGKPNDPDETDPDNDPHVGCFQVEFFNFDTGQRADITFTAHPPTGNNGVLSNQSNVLISNDGTAGAPNDVDAVFNYNTASFDLNQFTSVHPVHGWHVKLAITVYDADGKAVPGGKKHKVFWMEGCDTTTTTTGSTTTTTGSTTTTTEATTTTFEGATVSGVVINRPATTPAQVGGVQLPRTGLSEVFLMAGLTALSLGLVFEALAQMARRRSTVS